MTRVKKYGEQTRLLAQRVPESKYDAIKIMIEAYLAGDAPAPGAVVLAKVEKTVLAKNPKKNPSGCSCSIGSDGLFRRVAPCKLAKDKHKF
jgi:hypothetical protein